MRYCRLVLYIGFCWDPDRQLICVCVRAAQLVFYRNTCGVNVALRRCLLSFTHCTPVYIHGVFNTILLFVHVSNVILYSVCVFYGRLITQHAYSKLFCIIYYAALFFFMKNRKNVDNEFIIACTHVYTLNCTSLGHTLCPTQYARVAMSLLRTRGIHFALPVCRDSLANACVSTANMLLWIKDLTPSAKL